MDKIHLFVFIIALLVIASCGKDEDSIVGTYRIINLQSSACDDPGENLSLAFDENGCTIDNGIEVCLSGNIVLTESGMISGSFTLSFLGFTETTTFSDTYTYQNGTLTICDGNNCESATVDQGLDTISIRFPSDDDSGCIITMVLEFQ